MIQRADVIFTFDERNFRAILKQFPSAKSKIHRLSSLDMNAPFSIKDPYGESIDLFCGTYAKIKQILDSPAVLQNLEETGKNIAAG